VNSPVSESDIPDATRSVDETVDPAQWARAQAALGELTFLRPDARTPNDEMPADVWARLASVLAEESAARVTPAARSSRAVRWGGGLVAASVAVVAVGLGMSMVRGQSAEVAVVAGDVQGASAAALAEEFAAPDALSLAGMVPPVQMLVDSDTNYTRSGLGAQVASVMKRFGANAERKVAAAAPVVVAAEQPATWFTSDEQRLRDCVTKLTNLAQSTAVMVDRSTYEGREAGVVVAPEYETGSAATPVPDHWQVFVVDQDCNLTMEIQISVAP
jgi:hypothetical protein